MSAGSGSRRRDRRAPSTSAGDQHPDWRELVAVVLLSVTAILTAWSGFQASQWGGEMSISFSAASSARIEASRHEATANRMQTIQVGLFAQWLQAYGADDEQLTQFLEDRFPPPLDEAFDAWVATEPLTNPDAPSSPFDMEEYHLPALDDAAAADDRADAEVGEALADNQRGDNYSILTVAFATVLFFTALSGRMRARRSQWTLLAIAGTGFVICSILLLTFPKMV
jgi:hypothetical protein